MDKLAKSNLSLNFESVKVEFYDYLHISTLDLLLCCTCLSNKCVRWFYDEIRMLRVLPALVV